MHANNGGVPIGRNKGFVKPGASSLMWNAGSRTKTSDPQSVLTKARREAKEISQRGKLSKPSHQLSGKVGQVTKAPAGMVNEYRKAAEPPVRILSRRRNIAGTFQGGISGPSLEDREKRLRALTTSGGVGSKRDASGDVKETMVGSSDDDEDDMDEFDDLFDDNQLQSRPLPAATSKPSLPPSKSPPSRPHSTSASSLRTLPPSTSRGRPVASSSSTPKPYSLSPPSCPTLKPSDIVSSILSESRPAPHSSSPPLTLYPAPPRSRSSSPGHGESRPQPMIQRKRTEVDIFARPKKKPRAR
jgi:elongin-A